MKDAVRLLAKSLLVLFPLFALMGYLALCPLFYGDDELPYYTWTKRLSGQSYEVAILGDSTANAAFLPNLLGENVVNIALGGSTPVEGYYAFQNYLRKNEKPKVCYISYSDELLSSCECLYSRVLYSHVLTFAQEADLFRRARQFGEESVLVDGWRHRWISTRCYSPEIYLPALLASSFGDRLVKNRALYHHDDVHRGSYMSRSRDEAWSLTPAVLDSFAPGAMFASYYGQLVDLCEREGIQVRLVKLPVSQPVMHTLRYGEDYEAFLAPLLERHPDVTAVWIREGFDQHDFFDRNHMNVNGAIRFSRLIRSMYPADFSDAPPSGKTLEGLADYAEITNSEERKQELREAAAACRYLNSAFLPAPVRALFLPLSGEILRVKRGIGGVLGVDDGRVVRVVAVGGLPPGVFFLGVQHGLGQDGLWFCGFFPCGCSGSPPAQQPGVELVFQLEAGDDIVHQPGINEHIQHDAADEADHPGDHGDHGIFDVQDAPDDQHGQHDEGYDDDDRHDDVQDRCDEQEQQ